MSARRPLSSSPAVIRRQHVEPLSVSRRPLGPHHRRTDVSMSLTTLLLLLLNMMPTTHANKGACSARSRLDRH